MPSARGFRARYPARPYEQRRPLSAVASFGAGRIRIQRGGLSSRGPDTDLMILSGGRVKLSATSNDSREFLVNFVEEKDVFGAIAVTMEIRSPMTQRR